MKRILSLILIICLLCTSIAFGASNKPAKVTHVSTKGYVTWIGERIQWSTVKDVTGYKIYLSEDEEYGYKLYKTVKGKNTNYCNLDLESNKTYYVKVRAYKKIDNKTYYGSYSDPVMFVTKTSEPYYYVGCGALSQGDVHFYFGNYPEAFPVHLNINNFFIYDLKTGNILTQLNAKYYLKDGKSLVLITDDIFTIEPDTNISLTLTQKGYNKVTFDITKHGILYLFDYDTLG